MMPDERTMTLDALEAEILRRATRMLAYRLALAQEKARIDALQRERRGRLVKPPRQETR